MFFKVISIMIFICIIKHVQCNIHILKILFINININSTGGTMVQQVALLPHRFMVSGLILSSGFSNFLPPLKDMLIGGLVALGINDYVSMMI